jgi:hypothetical protein
VAHCYFNKWNIYLCILNFFFVGWDLRHQVLRPLLAYCTAPDDRWGWLWSNWWNVDWQGKPKYSEKTCSSATLSTTNPTWPDPGANPGRHGGKPATNRLSYGAALVCWITHHVVKSIHCCEFALCAPYHQRYQMGCFPWSKVARVWSWPFTSN